MDILFVCTGNTCRSPMAEGFCRQLSDSLSFNFNIKSAAIMYMPGSRISSNTVKAMDKYQIDVSGHKPKQLKYTDLVDADIVLTMTHQQSELLKSTYPDFTSKIYCLGKYIDADIVDPYGCDIETYLECAGIINIAVKNFINEVNNNYEK